MNTRDYAALSGASGEFLMPDLFLWRNTKDVVHRFPLFDSIYLLLGVSDPLLDRLLYALKDQNLILEILDKIVVDGHFISPSMPRSTVTESC
ncbi:hypothetical protein BQ8794_30119 [Mesorhizobium prunaredense]|uniref:Uncharacterized protein n=1 Tax=Mesorhizobium prunaredense TaxID=1631249 RepID=A0A1R3V9T0_9HYPH|nr:hypothetical protein BQ8794_30119 [Mesorhizobium prunaredense]